MNTRAIEVVGTYQGFWTRWVGQVFARFEFAQIHADTHVARDLDTLRLERPDSSILVFVEHPTIGLAHALGRNDDIDPESWLDDWLESARALQELAEHHPDKTVVVNADEVRRRPQRLAQLLRTRWKCSFDAPSRVVNDEQDDALARALAWSFSERDLALQDAIPAMMAICAVLPGIRSAAARLVPEDLVDGVEAARRLAALGLAERQLAQVIGERDAEQDALRREVRLATEECARLETVLQALDLERAALEARCEAADQALVVASSRLEAEVRERNSSMERLAAAEGLQASIGQELAAVRASADALERRHDEDQAALAHAMKRRNEVEQELVHSRKELGRLDKELACTKEASRTAGAKGELMTRQLAQVQEELERTFSTKRDAQNALQAARSGLDAKELEKELRGARDERELLLLQTQQMQQELERVHADKVRLAREFKRRVALPGLDDVSIGEVMVAGERDTPPHREVSFVVRDVRAGDRQIADVTVRLVEHWGYPGLVIFSQDGHLPLFETWREAGREDGRPYMLLVHGEESAQRAYDAMGALDWQLVQALSVRLGQALRDHAGDLSPVWPSLAQRLLTSLHELPARLRYGSVAVMPIEQAVPQNARFRLVLERVSYKARTWRRMPIHWQPGGATPSLDLGMDEEGGPPLLAWPADADGMPVRSLRLPLGEDPGAEEVRVVWDALSLSDRAFVAELLNLMPILAVHLQAAAASTGDGARSMDLQAAATRTMLLGRAALQPPRSARPQARLRRPLLQRMARRLGVPSKASSANAEAVEPALDR